MMSDGAEGNVHLEAHDLVNVSQRVFDSVLELRNLQAEVTGTYQAYLDEFWKVEGLRAAVHKSAPSIRGDTSLQRLLGVPTAPLQLPAPKGSIDTLVEGGEAHPTSDGESGELSGQIIDIPPQGGGSAAPQSTDPIADKTYTVLEPEMFLNPQIPLTMRVQEGETGSGFTYMWLRTEGRRPVGIVSRIPGAIDKGYLLSKVGNQIQNVTKDVGEKGRMYVIPLNEGETTLREILKRKAYSVTVQLRADPPIRTYGCIPELACAWKISLCDFSYDPQTSEFSIAEIDIGMEPRFSVELVERNRSSMSDSYNREVRFGHAKPSSMRDDNKWETEPLPSVPEGVFRGYRNVMQQLIQYTADTKQTLMDEKEKFGRLTRELKSSCVDGYASVLGSMFGIEETTARMKKE